MKKHVIFLFLASCSSTDSQMRDINALSPKLSQEITPSDSTIEFSIIVSNAERLSRTTKSNQDLIAELKLEKYRENFARAGWRNGGKAVPLEHGYWLVLSYDDAHKRSSHDHLRTPIEPPIQKIYTGKLSDFVPKASLIHKEVGVNAIKLFLFDREIYAKKFW